mgnify:CR=1 FL=1
MQSAISPDGTHILGGSSDGNVYLWQVVVGSCYHFTHALAALLLSIHATTFSLT